MKSRWSLQGAKNCLSQVVAQAVTSGPQTITVRGREKVVVLAVEDYRRLASPPVPLSEFFRQSPLYGIDLDVERSREAGRDLAR
jgi:antitoxin Phd